MCTHGGMHSILALHKPSHLNASTCARRHFYDGSCGLPGRGNTGLQRKSCCIKILENNLSLVFLLWSCCTFTWTWGPYFRVSHTLYRCPDTFPSKTHLVGKTFQGRAAETLGSCVVRAFDHLFETPWFVYDGLSCEGSFCWRELWGPATTRWIIEARSRSVFPLLDPCRHGGSRNLRDGRNFVDLQSCCAAQNTLGTHPGAGDGMMCRNFSEGVPLIFSQRTHVSHDRHPGGKK